jgi:hypothetical protein
MAAECADFHSNAGELRMYGFVVQGQGFYSIKIHGGGEPQRAAAIIHVLQGEAYEKKLEEELKNLINNHCDWQVRQVEAKEYVVVFPDKGSLDTFSKNSEILLSVHGIKIKVLKSNMDPDASEIVQTSWIKIYGLPSIACKEVVMKVTTLAREPLVVDELSLIKEGPVRVKMNCRDPCSLRGFVKIFFNMVGYETRFVSEKYKDKAYLPPPPPGDSRDDEGEDGGGEEDESDDDLDRNYKRWQGKQNRVDKNSQASRSGTPGGKVLSNDGGGLTQGVASTQKRHFAEEG